MSGDVDMTDSNGDGIPDVFENRPPISEILNDTSSEVVRDVDRGKWDDSVTTLYADDLVGPLRIVINKSRGGSVLLEEDHRHAVVLITPNA